MFDRNGRVGPSNMMPEILKQPDPAGRAKRDKTLLVISQKGVPSALAASIECEFRFLRVQVVPDLDQACTPLMTNVVLILVARDALASLACHHEDIVSWHKAPIAVLADTERQADDPLISLIDAKVVKGVISTGEKLDITLAACRILLSGGEYAPPALFRAAGSQTRHLLHVETIRARTELTSREWQILKHVSDGSQNKFIAGELGLSEHTVKIHIHNIIKKLGVHNRTEAAGYYFANRSHEDTSGNGKLRG